VTCVGVYNNNKKAIIEGSRDSISKVLRFLFFFILFWSKLKNKENGK